MYEEEAMHFCGNEVTLRTGTYLPKNNNEYITFKQHVKDLHMNHLLLYKDYIQKNYNHIGIGEDDMLDLTDNNVYPQGSDPKEWYESQHILFDFCEFLENEAYHQRTNKELGDGESEPKHIIKCRLLINAMDNIQNSINNAQY